MREQRSEVLGHRAGCAEDMPGAHAVGVSEHRQVQRKRWVGDVRQRLAKFVDLGVAEALAPPLFDFAGERPPHL